MPFPHPLVEEEKKEIEELLGNIKRVFKIRYLVVGGFTLVFFILKSIGVYPLPSLSLFLLLFLLASVGACDLLLRKTWLAETVNSASITYFIFQTIEAIIILTSLEISGIIPFVGALVLTLIFLVSYFSYTRKKYRWAVVILYTIGFIIVVSFEYLGILTPEDRLNIGVNIARNGGVFILSLSTGISVMIIIFFVVDFFSRKLEASFKILTQKEKELKEAKGALEIRVKARTRELEIERASLDERVQERTKELQEKMGELEKFQKIAVGRELKMIELKKEIKNLKEELGKIKG